ncbi:MULTISPECIES: flagellar hook capping FlgD N-terminal domain-containing protein [Tepidibacillus]|uniref:Flagellar hook assembly protein FlgD n=1 Tax=Tepidibacillus decaturensis TaxID=1413211 RepID=A0A135L367_9BACI|nr:MULTISPECIES: flagellar hook capping FlgD N-terminal domain-containing protein [Tepidibacillus]KXG43391.1 hypothetical protein U473_04705 [Tepidibacillus decaturensis]GBF11605.1 basal-body rod modification protein FlgD [Tepidibacillus sp. HK-1]
MNVTESTSTASNVNSQSALSEQSILGKDDFLKIFVTQLKNQDPLQPLQDREFIAQMAQFSTLEQIANLNKTTEKVLEIQTTMAQEFANLKDPSLNNYQLIASYSNLIGKKGFWLDQNGNETFGSIQSILFKENQHYVNIDGQELLISDLVKIE